MLIVGNDGVLVIGFSVEGTENREGVIKYHRKVGILVDAVLALSKILVLAGFAMDPTCSDCSVSFLLRVRWRR